MHDLCAIIVSDNGKRWLDATLTSLFAHVGRLYLDVVVVDNGNDGSADYVEDRFPGVRTIRCPDRGFGHAGNRALETASSRYVLFLDPNAELLVGSLDALTTALDSQPEVALYDWAPGSFMVRRTALESCGRFNEQLSPLSGRVDLCWRLEQAGWGIVHVHMSHPSVARQEQPRAGARLEVEGGYARRQFVRKRFPRRPGSPWPAVRALGLRRRW